MAKIKWKPAQGKTWRQKLEGNHPSHGKLVRMPTGTPRAGQTMLIPRPREVDAVMRTVRKGRLITASQIRSRLARAAGADSACPLTTGIFIRIAAEAAEEDRRDGKRRITPYWRTVRDDGSLNDKFPGGPAAQAARLRREGFRLVRKGRIVRVADFEDRLIRA